MSTITFRGKEYDANKLLAIAITYKENVPTNKISTLISAKSYVKRVAFKVDDTYHLLTGNIDTDNSSNELGIITKHSLKKAEKVTQTYSERMYDARKPPEPFRRSFSREPNGNYQTTFSQPRRNFN